MVTCSWQKIEALESLPVPPLLFPGEVGVGVKPGIELGLLIKWVKSLNIGSYVARDFVTPRWVRGEEFFQASFCLLRTFENANPKKIKVCFANNFIGVRIECRVDQLALFFFF